VVVIVVHEDVHFHIWTKITPHTSTPTTTHQPALVSPNHTLNLIPTRIDDAWCALTRNASRLVTASSCISLSSPVSVSSNFPEDVVSVPPSSHTFPEHLDWDGRKTKCKLYCTNCVEHLRRTLSCNPVINKICAWIIVAEVWPLSARPYGIALGTSSN
jgi:hypothetical protein